MDVFQFNYLAVVQGEAGRFFNFQDILAMYMACIGHDVGHVGLNNAHLIKTGHELALFYNDKAPLENMHARVLFETLRRPGHQFLSHRSAHDNETIREKVVEAVLATDMARHFEFVDRFSARCSKTETSPFTEGTKEDRLAQKSSKADRRMLIQAFVHMADLSHVCRPWDVHRRLVVNLEQEFFAQGDIERDLGLPVMPLMDRSKDSAAASQGFFLDKLVRPLLDPFSFFLRAPLRELLMGTLSENKIRWEGLVTKSGPLTATELVTAEIAEEENGHSG